MEMEKKNVAIIVLVIALVASGIGNIFLIIPYLTLVPPENVTFIRATGAGPHTLDPVNSWDSASNDVLDQICEGLFGYNFSDLDMARVNELAESYYWVSPTELQVKLREGIYFHDNTTVDANAVKWNFDRLQYFSAIPDDGNRVAPFNTTKPSEDPTGEPASLYFLPDGRPIFNRTVVVSQYNVSIFLNGAFAAFLDLLCFQASYIISPTSRAGIETDLIQLYEPVIGTGPFRFVSFTSGVEVRFERWNRYWQPLAFFQYVVFALISSGTARTNAMFAHQVDYCAGYVPASINQLDADPTITVDRFTERTGRTSLVYYYLGMNNEYLNVTWRRAISYALNYSYIIKNVYNDLVVRANSPIAPGYASAYNASVAAADYNLVTARSIMQSMGFGVGFTTDAQWRAATFLSVNYSYNTDNPVRVQLSPLVTSWLDDIGIDVNDDGITWDAFLTKLYSNPDQLTLYWVGWGPDYLDPFNMLDPLFNPASTANSAQVDDDYINDQLALALATTDDVARNNIYKQLQWYLVNSQYVHCFGIHPKITAVYDSHIHGVPLNAKQDVQIYGIYRS
ncbi:MAG: ABC transporter substrate-binding protein [Candidatus Thorarchaeota archaeon]